MTLRQSIENNPTIWLLSTLLVGFLSGFAAYQTILEVSGRVTVSEEAFESGKEAKAREGAPPKGHSMWVTATEDPAAQKLDHVELDEQFYIHSKWVGISGKRYYEQEWKLFEGNQVAAYQWHPFVPKADEEYRIWGSFTLDSNEHEPGKYQLEVLLNGKLREKVDLVVKPKDEDQPPEEG